MGRFLEAWRQAAQINLSATAAAAVGINGRAPTVFEAMVLADLDFIKLSTHVDYRRKEQVLDGVPIELAGPLQKNGEPTGYVISESLDRADKRVLEAAGRRSGEIGNIVCVTVSDEEYGALSKHPAYDFEPRKDSIDKDALAIPAHLRGRLERRGQNIVLLSASLAAALAERHAKIRAETMRRLDAVRSPNKASDQEASRPSSAANGDYATSLPLLVAAAPSPKPASWWARFIFPGSPIPRADAIFALGLLLGELKITVEDSALSFQSDPVAQGTFTSTLERLTGSDLGWRTLVQIYEREKQLAHH